MTTTHWIENADSRPRWGALWLILAAGFLLRVVNLGAGIPFAVGIDEPAIMARVVQILKSGDFNPHFFDYPSGSIYLHVGTAVVAFIAGAMQHSWRAIEHLGPADFYFSGRLVTAAIGTATIALVHQAGLRWGAGAALASAGLMAVMPMHVRESHFALTDVPLTFAAALTLLLSLRASEKPALPAFLLAGAAAGLTAGVKYNGLMAIASPLAVVAALGRGHRPSRTAAACVVAASCVAAFLVTTPFAVLDLPGFLSGFGSLTSAYSPRSDAAEPSWLIYAKHMRIAFGWPASLLIVGGLGAALYRAVRGPDRLRWSLLLAFPAAYFYVINGWAYMFARYALPIVPFLALGGGIATAWSARRLRQAARPGLLRKAAIAALFTAALLPGAIGSVRWLRQHGADSTQAQAWKWIRANIWTGSVVVSEARGLDLPAERYRVEFVQALTDRDPEAMAAAGAEWIILSSDAWKNKPAARLGPPPQYGAIMTRYREVKVIIPTPAVPGPEIRILQLPSR